MSHTKISEMPIFGRVQEEVEGALRVWHIPQVPGKGFRVPVKSPAEAKFVLDILAAYDGFQFENRIKPDYCNAGGLEVYENGEWTDWYSEDGQDIDDWAESST